MVVHTADWVIDKIQVYRSLVTRIIVGMPIYPMGMQRKIQGNLRNIHISAFCLKAYNTPPFLHFLDHCCELRTSSIRPLNTVLPSRSLVSNIFALRAHYLEEHSQRRPWAVVLVRASLQGREERWGFVGCYPSRKLRPSVSVSK